MTRHKFYNQSALHIYLLPHTGACYHRLINIYLIHFLPLHIYYSRYTPSWKGEIPFFPLSTFPHRLRYRSADTRSATLYHYFLVFLFPFLFHVFLFPAHFHISFLLNSLFLLSYLKALLLFLLLLHLLLLIHQSGFF